MYTVFADTWHFDRPPPSPCEIFVTLSRLPPLSVTFYLNGSWNIIFKKFLIHNATLYDVIHVACYHFFKYEHERSTVNYYSLTHTISLSSLVYIISGLKKSCRGNKLSNFDIDSIWKNIFNWNKCLIKSALNYVVLSSSQFLLMTEHRAELL